ncbi:MAG: ribosome biogenesis GTP-binding protein YsxC [Zetaproteobacteria bacterium]|nr:ribosome biogenesis GTP-binding protein YsxC [Pseudobdellovibrionaceae bacterium]
MDCTYITSAMKPEQLPDYDLPEVAFFGRSNTGKSTLLNSLTGRRNLARHGRTPGRTQMVNFFTFGPDIILADLPGFGYSAAAKNVAQQWERLVAGYVKRTNVKMYLFLMDCRRDPAPEDLKLMAWLSQHVPLTILLTKSDKISKAQLKKKTELTQKIVDQSGIQAKEIKCISNLKKTGIEELKQHILSFSQS